MRLGTEIAQPIEGVLGYSFDEWTLQVTDTLVFDESANPRPTTAPDVGGSLQVASYNVLNFFTTIDQGSNATGPNGDLDPRGADTAEEFARQSAKIVDGIIGTGAEVLALQEIENNGTTAIGTLVDLLNAEGTSATYAYVDPTGTGDFIGEDAITTGIIYDSSSVTLLHSEYLVYAEPSADATAAIASDLASYIGSSFDDYQRNRPSVAATFEDASGNTFTVVSSHFKSKGASGLDDLAGDAETWLTNNAGNANYATVEGLLADLYADPNFDQRDGQGFWNGVRLDAAVELADWIANTYNGGGTTNYALLGDMNSYAEEDAVQYLDDDAGLVDLIDTFVPGGHAGSGSGRHGAGGACHRRGGVAHQRRRTRPDRLRHQLQRSGFLQRWHLRLVGPRSADLRAGLQLRLIRYHPNDIKARPSSGRAYCLRCAPARPVTRRRGCRRTADTCRWPAR